MILATFFAAYMIPANISSQSTALLFSYRARVFKE